MYHHYIQTLSAELPKEFRLGWGNIVVILVDELHYHIYEVYTYDIICMYNIYT